MGTRTQPYRNGGEQGGQRHLIVEQKSDAGSSMKESGKVGRPTATKEELM
jgi:hypothetical protein